VNYMEAEGEGEAPVGGVGVAGNQAIHYGLS